jgi:TolB-like protein
MRPWRHLLVWAVLSVSGCVATREAAQTPPRAGASPTVAVFPVENLSGKTAPLAGIQQLLVAGLKRHGVTVLEDAALEQMVRKHRVRYTAGVERAFAKALEQEAGVDWIVIPSLELYDTVNPPRVSMFARMVSTGDAPAVGWLDGTGTAGDDAPGILGLGLIEDPGALLGKAVETLTASLARSLPEAGASAEAGAAARKFRPKIVYRSDGLDADRTYHVAVVPFFNRSETPNAGEIVALHMMRSLTALPNLRVVEPGIVREELLRFRIIMADGVSLPETDTILNAVNADLVLNGEVLQYRDRLGRDGTPSVDFGVLFIERKSRRIVYSAYSHNSGDDRVFFFDWGRVNTAHAMTRQMTDQIVRRMRASPQRAAREAR